MASVPENLIQLQVEGLRGYIETGGDIRLWLGSKGFTGLEKAAILRRFRELDGKRLTPVNPELEL